MRAHRTAEIIALEHKLTVQATKALRERSFGKYEGMNPTQFTQEIQELFSRWYMLSDAEWMKQRLDDTFETGEEMVSRMLTFYGNCSWKSRKNDSFRLSRRSDEKSSDSSGMGDEKRTEIACNRQYCLFYPENKWIGFQN
ncbi:histidine phosphatase family protein [Candidatus Roizmanbacteria bacterium]|nr:MAG: histidine phosphatase family protein [Candidatus Roizmanbacteria bacterium]